MQIKRSLSRRTFIVFNYVFCIIVGLICVIPMIHILALSLSSYGPVIMGKVTLWPKELTFDNYTVVTRDRQFFTSYGVTMLRAAVGWAISLILTMMAAYPMSQPKTRFPARKYFVWLFMGTMLFSGGMIPTYLVVHGLGLIDTLWALVLPGSVGTYYIILMMNFMKALPDEITESAMIDGASHFTIMWRIVMPLCKPSVATVSLFIILGHWNAWFDGLIYIRKDALKPLQTYLRTIIIKDPGVTFESDIYMLMKNITTDATSGAKIFLALIPILIVYPFLQKYFTKGLVLGSVKG